jgi:hypothetical protein
LPRTELRGLAPKFCGWVGVRFGQPVRRVSGHFR